MRTYTPDISLFFPTYNEEDNIADSVQQARDVLSKLGGKYEIIIVNDGSSDRTALRADELAANDPEHVRVVHHSVNKGYGAALWSGIQAARYQWVFFTDADLQFKLDELNELIQYVPEYKVVLGYRAPRRDPFMRLVNAKGWNILNRTLFGLKARDIDCAFKLFDRSLVASLPLETRGAAMSAEMLIRLQRQGIEFKEVPVTHLPRTRGSPTGAKLSVIIRAFKELFGLYRGDLGKEDTTYVQGVKFGAVGVINTLVDVVTYFVLTRFMPYFPVHILTAKFTTFFVGTICSFFLNRRFTFAVRGWPTWAEVAKFYSSIVVTVTANVASLWFFNTVLGIYDLIAVAMSTVLTFAIGFTFSKLWVFRKKITSPIRQSFGTMRDAHRMRPDKIDWREIARASNE